MSNEAADELRCVLVRLAQLSYAPNRVARHLLNSDINDVMHFVSTHPEAVAITEDRPA